MTLKFGSAAYWWRCASTEDCRTSASPVCQQSNVTGCSRHDQSVDWLIGISMARVPSSWRDQRVRACEKAPALFGIVLMRVSLLIGGLGGGDHPMLSADLSVCVRNLLHHLLAREEPGE